jgi:hypothetical protein
MNEITKKKIKVVAELLIKYTDPKPEYSGIWATEMAHKILKAIIDVENLAIGDDMVEKLNKEQKLL